MTKVKYMFCSLPHRVLEVYVNGLKQQEGVDYVIGKGNNLNILYNLEVGSRVTVKLENTTTIKREV
jgi:hypothetical protein